MNMITLGLATRSHITSLFLSSLSQKPVSGAGPARSPPLSVESSCPPSRPPPPPAAGTQKPAFFRAAWVTCPVCTWSFQTGPVSRPSRPELPWVGWEVEGRGVLVRNYSSDDIQNWPPSDELFARSPLATPSWLRSSQWSMPRTSPSPRPSGGRELQPEEMTEDTGWVQADVFMQFRFPHSQEPARNQREDGNQTAQEQTALSFSNIQRSAPGTILPWDSLSLSQGTSPALWGKEWRSPSLSLPSI